MGDNSYDSSVMIKSGSLSFDAPGAGLEYSIDNGTTWLKPSGDPMEVQFTGLVKDTEYTVRTRYGATDSSFASHPSNGVKVKTKNMFDKTDFIISPYSKAYDGKAHSCDIEIPIGAKVTFATELNGRYGTDKPEFTNAGDYVVYYCVEKENYYNAYGIIDVKIKKQPLMVTPKSGQTKIYGQSDPVLDYDYDGQVGMETPEFTGRLTREVGEENGNYPILQGTLALKDGDSGFKASNYALELPVEEVIFVITKQENSFAVRGKFSEDQNPLEWNNQPITITPANGFIKISTDGVHWMDSVTSGQSGKGLSLTFYLMKDDGSTISAKTIYYNCDMDNPRMGNVKGNPTNWQKREAKITFQLSDALSGIDMDSIRVLKDGTKNMLVQRDGDLWTFTTDGNGVYHVIARDLAGNEISEGKIIVSKIQTNPATDNKKPGSTGAKTGDEAPIILLFLITIVTAGIITTILIQMIKCRHR